MLATDVLEDFRRYASARQQGLSRIAGSEAIDLMVEFYRDVRADGCDPQRDADMLLFQYGTHDWGEGEQFEFDMTRQLVLPNADTSANGAIEDADAFIWQLHLTLRFSPTPALRALGSHNRWCKSPAEIDEFVEAVRKTAAFDIVRCRSGESILLDYESAG